MGLWQGFDREVVGSFPPGASECFAALNGYLQRVRTHLDPFGWREAAAIAYCGYLRADKYLDERQKLGYTLPRYCGPLTFGAFVSAVFQKECNRLQEVVDELAFSAIRLTLCRRLVLVFMRAWHWSRWQRGRRDAGRKLA